MDERADLARKNGAVRLRFSVLFQESVSIFKKCWVPINPPRIVNQDIDSTCLINKCLNDPITLIRIQKMREL